MNSFQSHIQIQRGGEEYRCHPQRFFYIKGVGWFVRTRGEIELSEGMELLNGILGPYNSMAKAKYQLEKIIDQENPDLFVEPTMELLVD